MNSTPIEQHNRRPIGCSALAILKEKYTIELNSKCFKGKNMLMVYSCLQCIKQLAISEKAQIICDIRVIVRERGAYHQNQIQFDVLQTILAE